MSTCPLCSDVAVAANRTLRIVGLGGGGPAGGGGGEVAHAVRIVAVTAETRIIAMALRGLIGFLHISLCSVDALIQTFFSFHRAPLSGAQSGMKRGRLLAVTLESSLRLKGRGW